MSKQRKNKQERKAAQRAAARDNTRVAKPKPAAAIRTKRTAPAAPKNTRPLTFGKETYVWMGAGFALVVLGLLLMSGGRGEDPTVFDPDVIYSFRKVTLAPIVMLTGLGVVIFGILKK